MVDTGRVAWREGMFLRPQHYQQQDRHAEAELQMRASALQPHAWGILDLKLNESMLSLGKFAVERCTGVFPDGTQFSIPGDMAPPPPLDLPADTRDAIVYLTLPLRQTGGAEFADAGADSALARLVVAEQDTFDTFSRERVSEMIDVATPNVRFGVTREQTDGRGLIGLACIREVHLNQVTLDTRHVPPSLDVRAATRLKDWLADIIGRADQQVEELAQRAVEATDGGSETFASFLMLQALNRWTPVLSHLRALPNLHPERLYEALASMAGELCTMSRPNERRPPKFPDYDHENLRATFEPVIEVLQSSLSVSIQRSAGQMKLQSIGPGAFSARIDDQNMFKTCGLYLAVSSRVPAEQVRQRFASVVKVGPMRKMRDIVGSALEEGIRIAATPTPPPQIRVLQGYTYFELDRSRPDFANLAKDTAIGLHIAGDWPDLKLELWWVKRSAK